MELTFNKDSNRWECQFLFRGREIELTFDSPQVTSPSNLDNQRRAALAKIESVWPEIEVRLGDQGLELFNENWGPAEDLPRLPRDEFLKKYC